VSNLGTEYRRPPHDKREEQQQPGRGEEENGEALRVREGCYSFSMTGGARKPWGGKTMGPRGGSLRVSKQPQGRRKLKRFYKNAGVSP